MYEKLGLRDRLLVDFFGWVTGIRLLNPPEYILTEEERAVRKIMPAVVERESVHNDMIIMDGGVSIH